MISHRHHNRREDEREEGDQQQQIRFKGMKLGFVFGVSDPPPPGEFMNALTRPRDTVRTDYKTYGQVHLQGHRARTTVSTRSKART
jgi:hypothetical protein